MFPSSSSSSSDRFTRSAMHWLLLTAVLAMLGVHAGRTLNAPESGQAQPGPGAMNPTTTVTVDLNRIFSELDEAQAVRDRLDAMFDEMRDHEAQEREVVRGMLERLEALVPGGPDARRLESELVMRRGALEGWMAAKRQLHTTEMKFETLRMYGKVVDAIDEMARANGYDYVAISEPPFEVHRDATLNDLLAEIFSRRYIYARAARDITDDLIARMNNAFNAGR